MELVVCYEKDVRMPRKIRQLKTDLKQGGAVQISQKGSHVKWKHPLVPDMEVVLAGHDGDDAKPYQEQRVRALLQKAVEAKGEELS